MLPNGNVYRCQTCHLSVFGGGPRNAFGQAVEPITGSSPAAFWTPALAAVDSDDDKFTNGEELGDPEGDGTAIPGFAVFNPGFSTNVPNPSPLHLSGLRPQAGATAASLQWSGGLGTSYLLQRKAALSDTQWVNYLTTSTTSRVVPLTGPAGFYRLVDRPRTNVVPLTVVLSGASEVPPVDSPGSGQGILSLEGNILSYEIHFAGLKTNASAAHIHGPASSAQSTNVIYPLPGASGTAGVLTGRVTLTNSTHRTDLLAGRTYINIHTPVHPGGEIRGQIQLAP